jgi:LysR family hydrogen peroxide-inducible transcriptional activator
MDGSSLLPLVQMVSSGIGVTLIPEMAVEVETRATKVATMHFEAPAPERTVGLIWRKITH